MRPLFRRMNALRVLALFLENPRSEVHLREAARKLRMSPSTVLRRLKLLEKEGLVSARAERRASFFKASMGSEFKALKVAYTLAKIESAGISELVASRSRGLSCLLLYGSAARGEDDAESDYDFLAVAAECDAKASDLSTRLGRETSLKHFSASEWKLVSRKNRAFYLEVISSCIPLIGEKPVID